MTSIRMSDCVLESLRSIWQDRLVDESWGSDPFAVHEGESLLHVGV